MSDKHERNDHIIAWYDQVPVRLNEGIIRRRQRERHLTTHNITQTFTARNNSSGMSEECGESTDWYELYSIIDTRDTCAQWLNYSVIGLRGGAPFYGH